MSPRTPYFPPTEKHLYHAAELTRWVQGALANSHSCLAFICGAPGSGKSHLALQASAELGPSIRVVSEDLHFEDYDALPAAAFQEALGGVISGASPVVLFEVPGHDLRAFSQYVDEALQAGIETSRIAWFVLDGGLADPQEVQSLRKRLPLALGPPKPEVTKADVLAAVQGIRSLFFSAPGVLHHWGCAILQEITGLQTRRSTQRPTPQTTSTESDARTSSHPSSLSKPTSQSPAPHFTSHGVVPTSEATKGGSFPPEHSHPTPAPRRHAGPVQISGLMNPSPLSALLAQYTIGPAATNTSFPAGASLAGTYSPLPPMVVAPPGGPTKPMGLTLGSVLNEYVRGAKPLPVTPALQHVRC